MRTRTLLFLLALMLGGFATGGVVPSFGQEQDEDVRGAFLTTRPKPAEKSTSSDRGLETKPATTQVQPRQRPRVVPRLPSAIPILLWPPALRPK